MKTYRQGDVLIRQCNETDLGEPVETANGKTILAYGEVTGHHHRFETPNAALFMRPKDKKRFLVIQGGKADLKHEEHSTLCIPAGTYEVVGQREWTDEDEPRAVQD